MMSTSSGINNNSNNNGSHIKSTKKKGITSADSETWILGTCYHAETKASDLRRHCRSLFRITYRRDFIPMHPYSYLTSDSGWGCMLRSAQMLMATAFARHYLGPGWRLSDDIATRRACIPYMDIIKLFLDIPGDAACFYSIHNIAQGGIKYDKLPGEWFGPSTAALVMRDLARLHRRQYGGPLEVLVADGDTIYMSEVEKICTYEVSSSGTKVQATAGNSLQQSSVDVIAVTYSESEVPATSESIVHTLADTPIDLISIPSTESAIDKPKESLPGLDALVPGLQSDATLDLQENPTLISDTSDRFQSPARVPPQSSFIGPPSSTASLAVGESPAVDTPLRKHGILSPSRSEAIRIVQQRVQQRASAVEADQSSSSSSSSSADAIGQSKWNSAAFFDPLFHPPPKPVVPWNCALVVLVPLRLGIQSVNEEYIEEIKLFLRNKYSIGFVGGRPNHAIYFAGYRDPLTLLGLDPHTTYPSIPKPHPQQRDHFPSDEVTAQIHVPALEELSFSRLDPSLCLGFYFRNRTEFDEFSRECSATNAARKQAGKTPMYYIAQNAPSYAATEMPGSEEDMLISEQFDMEGSAVDLNKAGSPGLSVGQASSSHAGVDVDDDEYIMI